MPLAQCADPWQKLPVGHMENEDDSMVDDDAPVQTLACCSSAETTAIQASL